MNENKVDHKTPTLDDIIVDDDSRAWLSEHQFMPSTWKIPGEELPRILAAHVGLMVFFSPIFTFDFSDYNAASRNALSLIFLDAGLLESSHLLREEVIAMCLHEIGHKVNKFKTSHPVGSPEWFIASRKQRAKCDDEHDADDYARHCGFEEALVNGLQKLIDQDRAYFKTPGNLARIQRIKKTAEIQRNF